MDHNVEDHLKNEAFDSLKSLLLKHEKIVGEIVNTSRQERIDKNLLVSRLASEALQIQVDVNNVLNQLLQR